MRLKKPSGSSPTTTIMGLRLYIVKNAPNSLLAIANLAVICKDILSGGFKLETIDVLEEPLRALADGILVTPSLIKLSPSPVVKIVGNLSDIGSVMRSLGITA